MNRQANIYIYIYIYIYTIYICDTKSGQSMQKAHAVCNVYGASSLYIETCWQSSFIYSYVLCIYIYIYIYCIYVLYICRICLLGGWGKSPLTAKNLLIPLPPTRKKSYPLNFYSLPTKS